MRPVRQPWRPALVALALAVAVAACRGPAPDDDAGGLQGPLLVSAAASLTDAFGELAAAFEARHPDVEVRLNLAGSSTLREQLVQGAPVDVLATASTAVMDQVVATGVVTDEPVVFATNRMQLAVPADNPGDVRGLSDLARDELFVGLCAPAVPCGTAGREVLATAGVDAEIDTGEPDVRALLAKVAAGELDVGLVYASDVAAADGVLGIGIDPDVNATVAYPIAVVAGAPNRDAAAAFTAFVLSPDGADHLRDWGFETP